MTRLYFLPLATSGVSLHNESMKDYCGLFGIYGSKEASMLTYLGLYALQHRGEESCGIVSSNGKRTWQHRAMGTIADVPADLRNELR